MIPWNEELKAIRIEASINLEDISRTTKIRPDLLEKIEAGDTSFVPTPYLRAFIREYAASIGVDPERAIARYDRKIPSIISGEATSGQVDATAPLGVISAPEAIVPVVVPAPAETADAADVPESAAPAPTIVDDAVEEIHDILESPEPAAVAAVLPVGEPVPHEADGEPSASLPSPDGAETLAESGGIVTAEDTTAVENTTAAVDDASALQDEPAGTEEPTPGKRPSRHPRKRKRAKKSAEVTVDPQPTLFAQEEPPAMETVTPPDEPDASPDSDESIVASTAPLAGQPTVTDAVQVEAQAPKPPSPVPSTDTQLPPVETGRSARAIMDEPRESNILFFVVFVVLILVAALIIWFNRGGV